jgi:NTP pyrophosphatase (non-canonical NTP hydrolase)
MNKDQFESITKWQIETFGNATALSKLNHLREEIEELNDALQQNDENRRLEFADCFILLFGCAASDGYTYEHICRAIDEKMKINKERKWGKANKNGVVNHIR